jgi:hypothetical protein
MRLIIKPRAEGAAPLHFFCPDGGGYVRLESDDRPGTLGRQICYGGNLTGNTVTASDFADFARECRRWYRAARRADLNR